MAAVARAGAEAARHFVDFVNETGSPYHAVAACTRMLRSSGFVELRDGAAPWALAKGGKYFVTKGGSDIMALVVGGAFSADGASASSGSGMSIVGAHTDSPCLRLRPNSRLKGAGGMLQVGVQTYGGGLWHTWLDRPLGLAGKLVVRGSGGLAMEERLVRVAKPALLIPNLAIHLKTADERKAFSLNTETELQPVLCSSAFGQASLSDTGGDNEQNCNTSGSAMEPARHHEALLSLVSEAAGCRPEDVLDLDLCLMDAQPSNIIGMYDEFISSPRIDNLLSTWAAVKGLCDFAVDAGRVENSQDICVAVSLDHEECGSQSSVGADGETLPIWLERVLNGLGVHSDSWPRIYGNSFLLSADCAHAVHPNYTSKHQTEHRPELHKGIVIKANANQRYATTALTSSLVRELCRRASIPVQEFVVRNDSPCGTTIGPILSSRLGIRAIDVGAPQWAMHSCRESCATSDAAHLLAFCEAFYATFRQVDSAASKL